jgi:hypothetical protein
MATQSRCLLERASGWRLLRSYDKGNFIECLLGPVGWVILCICRLYVGTIRSGTPCLASELKVPRCGLNCLKEEMINHWKILLDIRSLQVVLAAPGVLADVSLNHSFVSSRREESRSH